MDLSYFADAPLSRIVVAKFLIYDFVSEFSAAVDTKLYPIKAIKQNTFCMFRLYCRSFVCDTRFYDLKL